MGLSEGNVVFIQVLVTLAHTKNSFAKSFRINLNSVVRLLRTLMDTITQIILPQHLYV